MPGDSTQKPEGRAGGKDSTRSLSPKASWAKCSLHSRGHFPWLFTSRSQNADILIMQCQVTSGLLSWLFASKWSLCWCTHPHWHPFLLRQDHVTATWMTHTQFPDFLIKDLIGFGFWFLPEFIQEQKQASASTPLFKMWGWHIQNLPESHVL